jgi:methyl-accepting chemotaxis protein
MKQSKLSTKLLGGFLCVALITLGVGYLGWSSAINLTGHLTTVGKQSLPSIQNLLTVQKNLEAIRTAQNALLNPILNTEMRQQQMERVAQARDNYQKAFKIYDVLPKHSEDAKIWEQTKRAVEVWREENNKFFNLTKDLDKAEAVKGDVLAAMNKQLLDKCFPRQDESLALVDKLVSMDEEKARQAMAQADAGAARTKWLAVVGMVAGSTLALALGIILGLAITRPINRIIAQLTEGADQVGAASSQVSQAGQELAQGTSTQAASLEETSSSLEEMASMTRQNADNARQADSLMQETSQIVKEADHYMHDLTGSMQEISQASNDTAKIIKTIDEIAFQTNLLALNAAVEAARAGEAGAGFAVVADEVRNLAMRAAEAAKNTAQLIEGTVDKVKGGSDLVLKTGEAFGQVTVSAVKVQELVAEIAATSQEQAEGAAQISKAVASMDAVVQQVAANAEESASAAQELNAQAVQMKGIIDDLVVLVGGNSLNGNGSAGMRLALPENGGRRLPAAKGSLAGKTRALLGRHSQDRQTRDLTPEQIIPLEGDNFKDF